MRSRIVGHLCSSNYQRSREHSLNLSRQSGVPVKSEPHTFPDDNGLKMRTAHPRKEAAIGGGVEAQGPTTLHREFSLPVTSFLLPDVSHVLQLAESSHSHIL